MPATERRTGFDALQRTPLIHRNVVQVVASWAERMPNKIAFSDSQGAVSYAEALKQGQQLAAGLLQLGVGLGDPVLTMLDNHTDHVVTWLGLSIAHAVEVSVNTAYRGNILQHVVKHSEARVLIVEDHYLERFADMCSDGARQFDTVVVRGAGELQPVGMSQMAAFDGLFGESTSAIIEPNPWDTTAIMYTSGTTGPSKGVIVPHGHAFASAVSYPETREEDVVLVVMPLFHVGGRWAGIYNALIAGATAVIAPFSTAEFWRLVRERGCTSTLLVGAMVEFLQQQDPHVDDQNHPLKRISIVPLLPQHASFASRFGVSLQTGYGSTEAGSVIISRADSGQALGVPRADIESRVVDQHDIQVDVGVAGELVLRSSEPWALMAGYHRDPAASESAWRNLWFHTGDIMTMNPAGQYRFVDRQRDVIRRRGENVSSFEVESALLARRDIVEAAAIAVQSPNTDDDIKAVVVLAPGRELDPAELIDDLVRRLPYFMVPRYVEVVAELPKTPTQRTKKAELRAAGLTPSTWDRERAGLVVSRSGLEHVAPAGSPAGDAPSGADELLSGPPGPPG